MREEQVRALDDILEVRLPLRVNQRRHIGDVHRLGPSTARHEQVRLEPQVRAVPEVRAVQDDLAGRQLDVLVLDADEVAVLAELGGVKVRDRDSGVGEADELFAVEAVRIREHTASVDNGDSLVRAEQDLI